MSTVPPPHPSGYQPAEGEGFEYIDVTVSPSWGFQGVTVTGRYRFTAPRSWPEVLPVLDDIYEPLEEEAARRVDQLVVLRADREGAGGVPTSAPKGGGRLDPIEVEPETLIPGPRQGGGMLKYPPADVLPEANLQSQALDTVVEATGLDRAELIAFDNRDRLQSGQGQVGPAVVKARRDTPLALVMGKKDTVAWVGFTDQGGMAAKLSTEGKSAIGNVKENTSE